MGGITIKIPKPYPKQIEFYRAKTRYIAYGGARGGGKSHAARTKTVLLALRYPGLQILLLRRTLPELRENHTIPLLRMLSGVARYKEQSKEFVFENGSRIVLGYCAAERDVLQYQGQAYDVIFMEEATQFTEFQFQALTECNRSSGLCREAFSPRMYFTCNPGGVGHEWVKRLFITRDYRRSERAEDYTFIPAKVYDNDFLMKNSPDYVRTLENLPEKRRKAMLDGDWDIFDGQYFSEFNRDIHVMEPFPIPADWRRYFAMDYGLDMLAGYWIAVDHQGRAYVYRELYEGRDNERGKNGAGHIIRDAAARIRELTPQGEKIYQYIAPPDLWNRRQDSGKSAAELFAEHGVNLVKADNDRVQGWLNLHEWLAPDTDERGNPCAGLRIFANCVNLIRTLPALQFDDKDPNDCADEPHEITHAPDAIRYFVAGRPAPGRRPKPEKHYNFSWEKPKKNATGRGDKVKVV
jgi:phage terminase large subunit